MSETLSMINDFKSFSEKFENASRKLSNITDSDVDIATTPKEEKLRSDKTTLYRYKAIADQKIGQPVLIVYGLIGRQSMTDLQENRSLVRNLLAEGIDVYTVDWGEPNRADKWLTIDDYIDGYMDECIDFIREETNYDAINLMGICEGGTFSVSYACLYPEKVHNLLLAITPIDFHADQEENRFDHGLLNVLTRSWDSETIDKLIDANGCMPGELMGYFFQMMTPIRSLTKYNLDLIDVAQNDDSLINFLRMEKWIADRPDHPGEAAKQWFKDYYQENKLIKNEIIINGQQVDLKKLEMPVLNIFALQDHIIPPDCSSALSRHVGTTDYTEMALNAGHVGLFVSGRSQAILAPGIVNWLMERQ
ncbi:MAG: class III poly(R)-hydroxyalkanoic acid synthase subunit PhaC [Gammaproteobacteria bacterium]|nr:class III poly(R)-hydroxyalkanoic acid synthase subunit PhaC [Gammaproteobacteria bacterium]